MRKPTTVDGYPTELAVQARQMCLYIATILGDLLTEIVVVGGLAPYLFVDQEATDREPHAGTRDLDLGLSLAVLNDEMYKQLSARLRERGFKQSVNEDGRRTRQTWELPGERITIDFLIPETPKGPGPGKLQNLEGDFAAIVTPALLLAFRDFIEVPIDGKTPKGELAKRTVKVCGPAAFVAMKAHALRLRGENKDAYDLVYTLKNFGDGDVVGVAQRFKGFAEASPAQQALTILREDFASTEHLGPKRATEFLTTSPGDAVRADAFGYVSEFLRLVVGADD